MIIVEQIDARKERIAKDAALKLARSTDHLWVARGKKVVYLNLKKDKPSDAELAKLLMGPSGNLRAPTIRRGKRLFVGFNEEAYEEHLLG
ncbi:MAG: hypothetical protein IID44_06630 [Planctomycetes bacterium]|nr:hypothetical protein [Planctomycetota bacterium]